MLDRRRCDRSRKPLTDVRQVGHRTVGAAAEQCCQARPRPGQIDQERAAEERECEGDRGGTSAALRRHHRHDSALGDGDCRGRHVPGGRLGQRVDERTRHSRQRQHRPRAGRKRPAVDVDSGRSGEHHRGAPACGDELAQRRGLVGPGIGHERGVARRQSPRHRPQRVDDTHELHAGEIVRQGRDLGTERGVRRHHEAAHQRRDHGGPAPEARTTRRSVPSASAAIASGMADAGRSSVATAPASEREAASTTTSASAMRERARRPGGVT